MRACETFAAAELLTMKRVLKRYYSVIITFTTVILKGCLFQTRAMSTGTPQAIQQFAERISNKNAKETVTEIRREFRDRVRNATSDGTTNAYYANYELNRYSNIYLWDANRVRISHPIGTTWPAMRLTGLSLANEYIHASYVEDPTKQFRLIASQGPLEHTVADFWQMVFEHDASVNIFPTTSPSKIFRSWFNCVTLWSTDGRRRNPI